MAYVNGELSVKKGERAEVYFDKSAFIFATDFTADEYFADDLNWKRIALHFKDATLNQRDVVILKDDHGRGWFEPSTTSRTGDWILQKIEIFDKDGDFFPIESADIPEEFKITVQRVIAPASKVVSIIFESGAGSSNLLVNGDFEAPVVLPITEEQFIPGWFNGSSVGVATVQTIEVAAGETNSSVLFTKTGALDEEASVWAEYDVTSGRDYVLEYEVTEHTMTGDAPQPLAFVAYAAVGEDEPVVLATKAEDNGVGVYSLDFTPMQGRVKVAFGVIGTAGTQGTMAFDNISLKLKELDTISVQLEEGTDKHYIPGFRFKLWNQTTNAFVSNDVYTIVDKVGTVLRLDKATPVVDIETNSVLAKYPNYADTSGEQSALYEYVGVGY